MNHHTSHRSPRHLIIHDHPAPECGGIENMAYSIACALHARGERVAVAGMSATLERSFADQPGIDRVALTRPVRHPVLCAPRLTLLLLRLRARYGPHAVVHMLVFRNVRMLRWLGPLAPRRCVGYLHGNEVVRAVRTAPGRFARDLACCEHVVCNSQYTHDWARRCGSQVPMIVLHPRINLPARPPGRTESRRRFGLAEATPVCVMVSRLTRRKGHLAVLRTIAELRSRLPHARLLIAGTGPMRAAIETAIAGLDLQRQVRLLGQISEEEKWALLAAADFALMPSLTCEEACDVEGFGIANIEAAAMGAVPVGTPGGGVREALDHGRAGILLRHTEEEQIPAELAAALTSALADPAGLSRLRDVAQRRARLEFTWDPYAATLAEYTGGGAPMDRIGSRRVRRAVQTLPAAVVKT